MLDLRRLRTFREVLAHRSFSAAARELDYTQSSVSQQITALERELGVTLIDRGSRPIKPTAAGNVVLSHAQALLGHAAKVERELTDLERGESGSLRLGAFFTAWATFMPAAVATFSRSHPRVQLELQQLEPESALHALTLGDLDLAVTYRLDALPPATDRLAWTHLLDDPFAVALPAGHPLALEEGVSLAALAAERWVSPPADHPYTRLLFRACHEHGGFAPNVAYETADIAMAQPLVAAGLAVALLPALGLVPTHAGVVVRPLPSTPPPRSVWAVRPGDRRAPTAAAMTETLVPAAAAW
ncbi:MAG: LysR family transcriptional regulator [Chloroflexota bacterium]|nr:LysR family transcriptional regulator [Chloroflexota bacterium]